MLDLRLPIGYFFLINGIILVVTGLLQPSNAVEFGNTTINLNAVWGVVLTLFGAFMTGLSHADRLLKRSSSQPSQPTSPESSES